MKIKRIAIDFDDTIVDSKFPEIIGLKNGAKEVINKWYEDGKMIIINSCRSNEHFDSMVAFLNENGIKYHLANENDPVLIDFFGMDCRKMSADIYIDDRNLYNYGRIDWNDISLKVEELEKLTI